VTGDAVVLDTSALLAILLQEPDAQRYSDAIAGAPRRVISAATLVEAGIVAEGRGGAPLREDLDALLARARAEVADFTAAHAATARDVWRRFGKGRHPAGLNLGDCFAYALAQSRGEPLLYKGTDFAQTDVKAAL
jgi:ribonuclease VapC